MGRNVSFDREKALRAALKSFWLDGFDNTSIEDLQKSMQIKTSSFYNTFKSKEDLFCEALDYYRKHIVVQRQTLLRAEFSNGKEALLKYFHHLIYHKGRDNFPSGCFIMKTAAGQIAPESRVGREVWRSIRLLEDGFTVALSRGQKQGHFPTALKLKTAARLLVSQAYGISVLSRTKKAKRELLHTAYAVVELLSQTESLRS